MNELYTRPALSFLDWMSFTSGMDNLSNRNYADQQYIRGLRIGDAAKVVNISVSNVWSAVTEESTIQSYEKIGYHAHTAHLLRGFIDSGVRIVVWRQDGDMITNTVIQEGV